MNRIRAPGCWPLLIVAALFLAGCQYYRQYLRGPLNPQQPPLCDELAQQEQSPDNLPFETIARESYGIPWEESEWTEPDLFVLTSGQDISAIEPYIAPDAAAALKATDFDDAVVLAAFSGWQGHAAWKFCVTSITQQQGEVFLHTHLVDSPVAPNAAAFYYHLLRVPREQLPPDEVAFRLALTRHLYVNPTGIQQVIEASEEENVVTVIRSLP
jgi:hypothetical protein